MMGCASGHDSGDAVSQNCQAPEEFRRGTIGGVGVTVENAQHLDLEQEGPPPSSSISERCQHGLLGLVVSLLAAGRPATHMRAAQQAAEAAGRGLPPHVGRARHASWYHAVKGRFAT